MYYIYYIYIFFWSGRLDTLRFHVHSIFQLTVYKSDLHIWFHLISKVDGIILNYRGRSVEMVEWRDILLVKQQASSGT